MYTGQLVVVPVRIDETFVTGHLCKLLQWSLGGSTGDLVLVTECMFSDVFSLLGG